MKLTHIFWSLLILVLLIFIPGLFYRNNSKLGGGAELLGYFLLLWLTTTIVSPVLLILCWTKAIRRKIEFAFTFLALSNLYFGAYGIYLVLTDQVYRPGPFALKLFILNLLSALIIILHIVRRTRNSSNS
jgi:hypothetical protein